MINIHTDKSIKILLPQSNKALQKVLQSASPKELEKLSEGKDLKSILNTFLKGSSSEQSSNRLLLNLLKNNPTMRDLANTTKSFEALKESIKEEPTLLKLKNLLDKSLQDIKTLSASSLKTTLENSGTLLESKIKNLTTPQNEIKMALKTLVTNLENTKLPNLQEIIKDIKLLLKSELFQSISNDTLLEQKGKETTSQNILSKKLSPLLESLTTRSNAAVDKSISPKDALFSKETQEILTKLKLLNPPEGLPSNLRAKELFTSDLKALLLQTESEVNSGTFANKTEILKHTQKLLLQIDYHQLVSYLSSATSLYIPYSWDALEDGKFEIKNQKDGRFFTDIELTLKEYGSLKLRLGLFNEKELNINITTESQTLKERLKEEIPLLKKALFSLGLHPKEIRFLDEKHAAYDSGSNTLAAGFEVKA